MKHVVSYILLFAAICSAPSFAMDRFEVVTTKEMEQLFADRLEGKTDFLLINSLDELLYKHQSIPGSINVPWCKFDETRGRLGNDKKRFIVVY